VLEQHAVLQFRILGPLEVSDEGSPVRLGGQKQRAVLAVLLLQAGRVVSVDHLVHALWGERPPRSAVASLQNFVSQLRKLLGNDVVVTRAPGYTLQLKPVQLDLDRFERLVDEARPAEPQERAARLREALALWRGPPLADFTYEPFAASEIERLEELRLGALEERLDADLELGLHAELAGELEVIARQHPLRERVQGQLMLALYRSGRQAEALEVYHGARARLDEELGIAPSPALQQLYRAILRQEANLEPGAPGRPFADHYDEVLTALAAGRLVLVVGSLVNRFARPDDRPWQEAAYLPDDGEVAAHLAKRFDYPPDLPCALPRVSQFVAATRGIGPLYDELHELFGGEHPPAPVHTLLADLPRLLRRRGSPCPLVVTAGFDLALEHALDAAGEEYDVVSYIALGRDRGKFLHAPSDGPVHVIDVPNAYAELDPDQRIVILRIHGQVDREHGRERDSFVAREDDYIDYLAQTDVSSVIPVTLAARLRRSHFLFLGYPFEDWHLRVFLHRAWRDEKVMYRSWAVAPRPPTIERELWRQSGVDVFDLELDEYVERLGERLSELAGANQP
jgi:DNA-binding SARP family transcriptional activator